MREEEPITEHGAENSPVQEIAESEFDEARVGEIAERWLRVLTRKCRPDDQYDMEKALAALERGAGCISDGSLAQNIDDDLYGPME